MTCVKCDNPRYSNSSYCRKHHAEFVKAYRDAHRSEINQKNKVYMAEKRAGKQRQCEICRVRNRTVKQDVGRGLLCKNCLSLVSYVGNAAQTEAAKAYIFKWDFMNEALTFETLPDDIVMRVLPVK